MERQSRGLRRAAGLTCGILLAVGCTLASSGAALANGPAVGGQRAAAASGPPALGPCSPHWARTDFAVGANSQSVAIADLNGDGKPDLAVANYKPFDGSGNVSVLLGNGSGGFGPKADFAVAVGASPYAVAVGDLDADGKADLAVVNYGSDSVSVLLNGCVTYPLGVTLAGTGGGGVSSQPAGIACPATCSYNFELNVPVTLTATPADGSVFGGWGGTCTNTGGTCQVTMDQARGVTATFNRLRAPTGLALRAGTVPRAGGVQLQFTDTEAIETGFRVERKPQGQPDSAYAIVATAPASSPPSATGGTILATDATAQADASYVYRARAVQGTSASAPSAPLSVLMPPAAPTNATAASNASGTRVTVTWQDHSTVETSYQVQRGDGASGVYQTRTLAAAGGAYVDAGVVQGSVYAYRVRAVRDVGGGVVRYSAWADAPAQVVTPLPSPINLAQGTVTGTSISFTWQDRATTETAYELSRRAGATGPLVALRSVAGGNPLPANSAAYTDATASPGVRYSYQVRAVRTANGSTVYSAWGYAPAIDTPLPAPTHFAHGTLGPTFVPLTWADAATTETGYTLDRRKASEAAYTPLGTLAANATAYNDGSAAAGTAYAYRLRAYRTLNGSTVYSAPVYLSLTTPAS